MAIQNRAGNLSSRKRRLHSDRPFWGATPRISVPSIRTPTSNACDVIIVGTGISGALMAEAATRRKGRVLVVDRRQPVRGSSLASTAMIQHEIDVPLHLLSERIGADRAARAWRRSVRAVGDLVALTRRLDIDCHMEARQALYLTGPETGLRAMQTEARMREAAGIAAEYLHRDDLQARFGIDRTGAILSTASASANPAQLTAGLLREAASRGAEIVSPVEITDMTETTAGVVLATGAGRVLTAGQVVFCTGYEFLPVMESRSHRIISTWALASEPGLRLPGWLEQTLVWEAADPYLYFRSAGNGRLIIGGEDEDDADSWRDPQRMASKVARLGRKLKALCGVEMGRPAYAWAAPFGNTKDGLPIIDRVPGMRHAHTVMGFGGNGITFSMIAAQIISARLAGREDADAELFAFR